MSEEKTPNKGLVKYSNEEGTVKQSLILNIIIKLTVVFTIIACIAMTVYLQSSIAEKEKKYNQILEQIEDLEIKNEELNLTLNSDDIEAYMQKLAVEKYGYAYPDEIRFYDKSHN